jgi:sulfhydrogenase subunit delta
VAARKTRPKLPRLAVWKFASCDGCQLSILDCEDELLALTERVHIAYFPEATRTVERGPYDVSLVEGSITTQEDAQKVQHVRAVSKTLVTIGACATAGGIQALRNVADVAEYASVVYPHPSYLSTLERSTPIGAHVTVDLELRGCPIDRGQLLEVLTALLHGRRPRIPDEPVCVACKRRGTPCVMVAAGTSCLGPVTQSGCGAICPAYSRGCYGCFGPSSSANAGSMVQRMRALGMSDGDVVRALRTFNAGAEAFRAESARVASGESR